MHGRFSVIGEGARARAAPPKSTPMTACSSCLKRLNNYLHITMGHERLSGSDINWMWFISSWQCRYWKV